MEQHLFSSLELPQHQKRDAMTVRAPGTRVEITWARPPLPQRLPAIVLLQRKNSDETRYSREQASQSPKYAYIDEIDLSSLCYSNDVELHKESCVAYRASRGTGG